MLKKTKKEPTFVKNTTVMPELRQQTFWQILSILDWAKKIAVTEILFTVCTSHRLKLSFLTALERKFQILHDKHIVKFKCDKWMSQTFYKSLCQKEIFSTLNSLDLNFANVEKTLIPYLTNLEILNELSSYFLNYKQIYKQISMCMALFGKYFFSYVKRGVNIWYHFLYHCKEWTDQEIRKQKLLLLQPKKQKKRMAWTKIQTTIKCRGTALLKCCDIWPNTSTLLWF